MTAYESLNRVGLSIDFVEYGNIDASAGLLVETPVHKTCTKISKLLTDNNLPLPDTNDKPVRFITASQSQRILACLGWESYGICVLLRSLAVKPDHQRQGIGSLLLQAALTRLIADGVSEFYLLTGNAVDFAARFGFEPIDRLSLPEVVKTSQQVASGCCSTAQCMQLHVDAL